MSWLKTQMFASGQRRWLMIVAASAHLLAADGLLADALVVTRAMKASTIAEIFVDESQIRVEIEVGVADLEAFQNILPDELFEKLTGEKSPLIQRLQSFLEDNWVILADGALLAGDIERIAPGKRVIRDEVTGEPLAVQPDEAEIIVEIGIAYTLKKTPISLTIRPPTADGTRFAAANIGFVVYHQGVAVNDFRYLSQEATLDLDWEDPWHSRFRNRNLRRQFDSPVSAFLYVEPFEVRKEIIVRPKDLQRFLDLGLDNADTIPVNRQAELKRQVGQFLEQKNPVLIDGKARTGQLDRIHFVRRTLRRTGIVDPPEDLDVTSATLGLIFIYPIDELPQEVTMEWELFNDRIQTVPSAASDEAGPLPATLTPQDPVLHWRNFLKNPTLHKFASVTPPPQARRLSIPLVTLVCAAMLLTLGATLFRSYKHAGSIPRRGSLVCLAIAIVGLMAVPYAKIAVANPFAASPPLTDSDAEKILGGLLYNVYRAFDRRDHSVIYDHLSHSITGDLLEQVYLDTRKSIEIENQGGLRIKVNEVTMLEFERISATPSELTFRCHWRVSGSVGHWGHVHQRVNQPAARITIAPVDGSWKIIAMEMMQIP